MELRIPSLELLNHILENKDKIQRLNETLEKCFVNANAGEAQEDSYIL